MGRVDGKVIFITGAARGQGRAHAVRLAEEGANLILVDICADIPTNLYPLGSREELDETVALVEKLDRRAVATVADVRDPAALRAAVDAGVAELGPLDGIIAQAGICPITNNEPQAFIDAVTVDFNGVVHAIDAGLPHVKNGGSIAATGSVASMLPGTVADPANGVGSLGYALAKRMVSQFMNDLAIALAPRMIRVNTMHPTNCNTMMMNNEFMYRAFRPDLDSPTREQALEAYPSMQALPIPFVEPEDIANGYLFLMSDESRYVTGTQFRVDAGAVVHNRPQQPTF